MHMGINGMKPLVLFIVIIFAVTLPCPSGEKPENFPVGTYLANLSTYALEKWLQGEDIDKKEVAKDVYGKAREILTEMNFDRLPVSRRNEYLPEIKKLTAEVIHDLYEANLKLQKQFENIGNSNSQLVSDYYPDGIPVKLHQSIDQIRINVGKLYAGAPDDFIKLKQDEQEGIFHERMIQTLSVDTTDKALAYLNIPRVRKLLPPVKWKRYRDKFERDLRYKEDVLGGLDNDLSKQLMRENKELRDEVDMLREELGEIKVQLGQKPNTHYNVFDPLDDSTEARLYKQTQKLDDLINRLMR